MADVLKIKNEHGVFVTVPALKGDDYVLTDSDKEEIAEMVRNEHFNDIETALSELHAYAQSLTGGDSE